MFPRGTIQARTVKDMNLLLRAVAGIRTRDLRLTKASLYQLSYNGVLTSKKPADIALARNSKPRLSNAPGLCAP